MRLRSSAYACWFGRRAEPYARPHLFAFLAIAALLSSSGIASCGDWKPKAGPVRPELLIEGATRVEISLDETERYLLVSRFETDEDDNEQRRFNIVDWKKRTRCELPENVARVEGSLFGPSEKRKQKPLFLLPVILQEEGDGEQAGPQVLTFYDEHCQLYGETDYGPVSTSTNPITLDEDGRQAMLYGNGKGTLALADPWRDERTQITTGFRAFSSVYRAGVFSAPQLLWIIENGRLTQRALDGTLVLSFGQRVTSFSQVLLSQLRIAYVDDGNVYEAVGPDFEATQIAVAACSPVYRGNFLELQNPCVDNQLVRINLMTGETTEFPKGVFDAYTDSGYSFETQRDDEGLNHQYVEQPGRERVELAPSFFGRPSVVDNDRLAGIKYVKYDPKDPNEPADSRQTLVLSTYSRERAAQEDTKSDPYEDLDVFAGERGSVESFYPVPDYRTSSYWWLVFHNKLDSEDAAGHALGTLSVVSALDLRIVDVAENVPLVAPLPRAPSVRGFSIENLPTFTKERAIAYIDNAVPLERDTRASRGTLHVRLFSGELGSTIADDVTSYHLVSSPLPGVLYGVEEGEQLGLWFAAL